MYIYIPPNKNNIYRYIDICIYIYIYIYLQATASAADLSGCAWDQIWLPSAALPFSPIHIGARVVPQCEMMKKTKKTK